jgi:hypothetical protein
MKGLFSQTERFRAGQKLGAHNLTCESLYVQIIGQS